MHGQSGDMGSEVTAGRLAWVDAAKGIGILLVVAGHVWTRGPLREAIYAFHMPLFFLLSGYMVRPQPMAGLVMRQARSLLVPFAAFCALLIAADFTIEWIRGVRPIFSSVGAAVWDILFKTETLRGPFTILWFIPCLLFARIVWNGIALRMPDPADWRWVALVALGMASAHFVAGRTTASPLGLMAVPAAVALYWAGQLWRARPPGRVMTALCLAPFSLAALLWLPPVNLKLGEFGMPVLSLAAGATLSILLCLGVARLPGPLLRRLSWLGRASLVVMYVHVAFIHYSAPYLGDRKWALFAIAVAGSALVHWLASATRPGRLLLLGERASGIPILTPNRF